MKVILLRDVAKIGRRFDVTDVASGYALNKLIPQGFAEAATPENIKRIQARKNKADASQAVSDDQFMAAVALAKDAAVVIAVQANEKGHLFEALKPAAIAEAAAQVGVFIAPQQIKIETPIKEVGEYSVTLQEGAQKGVLTISVTAK